MCPRRRAPALVPVLAALALLAPARSGLAQENFEIQVYGAETVAPGQTMVELHSNVAAKGTTRAEGRLLPTQGALHETLEVTHGVTPWFETGVYLFTSLQPDDGWYWVGTHVRPRVRAPDRWGLPVGLSLSLEVGYQRPEFSADSWSLELRPIVDRTIGPWYLAFNPTVERSLRGPGTDRGFEFSPAAKVAYDVTPRVAVGLEYYGALGPVKGFDARRAQQHQIFPVVDVDLGPRWEFNAGVGIGLTPATDGVIVKVLVGYRFGGEVKEKP